MKRPFLFTLVMCLLSSASLAFEKPFFVPLSDSVGLPLCLSGEEVGDGTKLNVQFTSIESEESGLDLKSCVGISYGFSNLNYPGANVYGIRTYGVFYRAFVQKSIAMMDYVDFVPYLGLNVDGRFYSHVYQISHDKDSVYNAEGDFFVSFTPSVGIQLGTPNFLFSIGAFYTASSLYVEWPSEFDKFPSPDKVSFNARHSLGFSIGFIAQRHLYFEVSNGYGLKNGRDENEGVRYYSFSLGWMF